MALSVVPPNLEGLAADEANPVRPFGRHTLRDFPGGIRG